MKDALLRGVVPLVLLVTIAAAGAAEAARRSDSDVELVNRSAWDIHELYLSSVDDDEWGPDQLGDEVIESGGSFLLHSIPCDDYDVLLVDEDGDECVLEGVGLCGDSEAWVITSKDLLACQFGS